MKQPSASNNKYLAIESGYDGAMMHIKIALLDITLVLCLALKSVGLAMAEPVVEIERLTWEEIRDKRDDGFRTIIIPTGGTEQNGPHLVLGKHNIVVRETARRIALRLGNTLVAPVVSYVPEGNIATRSGHMAFPGTISIPDEVFENLLVATAESFVAHGFSRIVFLGDSGGNQIPQRKVADQLNRLWTAREIRVVYANAYYAENGGNEHLRELGESVEAIGSHAGMRDTSEAMAIDPNSVRKSRLKDAALRPDLGATGDPRRASADIGERLLRLKVQAALNDILGTKPNPI